MFGGMIIRKIKKNISYIIIIIFSFKIPANVCFNLTNIIRSNIELKWNFNTLYSLLQLGDISLLFDATLLSSLMILFVIKYDKEFKIKLNK